MNDNKISWHLVLFVVVLSIATAIFHFWPTEVTHVTYDKVDYEVRKTGNDITIAGLHRDSDATYKIVYKDTLTDTLPKQMEIVPVRPPGGYSLRPVAVSEDRKIFKDVFMLVYGDKNTAR